MKKNELERRLQRIPPQSAPKAYLEQYSTPAAVAADILFIAYSNGHIHDRKVVDLGCGNGIFAIGSMLLGASEALGVDIDQDALDYAARNASALGVTIQLVRSDVRDFTAKADTVIQNPPFGSQKRQADRPFLEVAVRTAEVVYSLHMAETIPFLETMVRSMGRTITFQKSYKFEIPHMFEFHDRKKKEIDVVLMCIQTLEVKK
jgi:putative methylase